MIKFDHDSNLTQNEIWQKINEISAKIVQCKNLDYDINNGVGYCNYFARDVYCYKEKNICLLGCNICLAKNSNYNYYDPSINNFAIVAAYFNPQKSENRYQNFLKFSQHMADLNIPFYAIEGYYYKDEPQLTQKDCQNLYTIEYYDILWQKERLLNILIDKLPPEVDCFGWFDADIIFSCDNLKEQCEEILKYYPVIQPWKKAYFLKEDNIDVEQEYYSLAYCKQNKFQHKMPPHPGFAWCMRRKEWNEINKFYDYIITGNGDTFLQLAFYGNFEHKYVKNIMNVYHKNFYMKWANDTYKIINGQIGYLDIELKHLYHGKVSSRPYFDVYKKIEEFGYCPQSFLDDIFDKTKPLKYKKDVNIDFVEFINENLIR